MEHDLGDGVPPTDWEGRGRRTSHWGDHTMYGDSVLYTIGTALNRAQDNHAQVQILVEGQWLHGQVAAVDGHGVVLASDDYEHSVIRMGSISAVRMFAAPPHREPITAGDNPMAHPMPAGA